MVFALLLGLVACGGGDDVTNPATNPTQGSTQGTTVHTEPPHTHSYTAKVTTDATCTADGVKTFTCTCGDTYTESIPAQHLWGEWQVETIAMIGRSGSEKRICSACSASEIQERTANAIANSFYDAGFVYFGQNDACILTGPGLLYYAIHTYPEFRDTPVLTQKIFGVLMDHFPVAEKLISDSKYWGSMTGLYNETDDTFTISYDTNAIEDGNLTILGYVHQGDNTYAVYFLCNNGIEDRYCEFVLEYNRLNNEPNYYVSSGIVSVLPDEMVKCAEGEHYELAD